MCKELPLPPYYVSRWVLLISHEGHNVGIIVRICSKLLVEGYFNLASTCQRLLPLRDQAYSVEPGRHIVKLSIADYCHFRTFGRDDAPSFENFPDRLRVMLLLAL
ncbi:hypothetical protein GOP47_0027023 [Adiantum capillus-veneris]|nr:hypothetical protein GOP47_0027023 [Adiantum capillus-veneris]